MAWHMDSTPTITKPKWESTSKYFTHIFFNLGWKKRNEGKIVIQPKCPCKARGEHLSSRQGKFQLPCVRSLSLKCCGRIFFVHSSFVCDKVGLITGMTTLRVVGGNNDPQNHHHVIGPKGWR